MTKEIERTIREATARFILELDETLPKSEGSFTLEFQLVLERFVKVQLQLRGVIPLS